MSIIKLEDIITFTLGKNQSRMDNNKIELYKPNDFDDDLDSINIHNNKNECIINLIKSKAAPLSTKNENKFITSNFLKCEFDEHVLDKWYFCYQFNQGQSLEQQIAKYHQGTTLSVRRLNVKIIGDLRMNLPDIKQQRIIGGIYRQMLIQNRLMIQQAEDYKKMTIAIIRKAEENNNGR